LCLERRVPVWYRGRGAVPLDPGTAVRYRTAESHTGGQRYAVRILSSWLAVVPRGAVPHRAYKHSRGIDTEIRDETVDPHAHGNDTEIRDEPICATFDGATQFRFPP
jgi:hypothetical protein